jgi:polysaccharide deacetylase 2 family uncharacterized protein YibQ
MGENTASAGTASEPGRAEPVPARYRGLLMFWAVVLGMLTAGAVTLQVLGPVRPVPKPGWGQLPAAAVAPPTVALKPNATPGIAPPAQPAVAQAAAPAAKRPTGIPPPDPALQEPAPDFPGRFLPIAVGERGPATAYAAPFDDSDKHPRVAMIISGAGLDQDATLHLLADLPPAIDVAFSAYMPESLDDEFAAKARQTGHECLVSIPMEPALFPLTEEGSHSLLTGADPEQNRQNLEWALSRLTGCVGATGASDGMLGERYAQTASSFDLLLTEVTRRGLLYLDPRTGAPALDKADPAMIRVVSLVVDPPPNPDDPVNADTIDNRLGVLEHMAAVHGSAIGLAGPPKPVLLERIAIWARGLAARGITLAPLTAIAPAAE